MKRKLLGILLALVMCLPLVVPAFAEPAEEPAAPEETVTLPVEAETPAPEEAAVPEEEAPAEEVTELEDTASPKGVAKPEETWWARILRTYDSAMRNEGPEGAEEDVFVYGHFHCLEEVAEEDGTTWQIGYQCADTSCPYLQKSQTTVDELFVARDAPPGTCHGCGLYNWGPEEFEGIIYEDTGSQTTHKERDVFRCSCQTLGCTGWGIRMTPWRTVAHSWSQDNVVYSNQGANHTAEYHYTCVCGATKTATTEEEHSFNKTDFGDNYHLGLRHYVEWKGYCSQCKCALTKWESYSCPGNNNGVGCVFPINKVDPPVEAEDVTEPEDEDFPEEAAPPGDEIAPGETAPGEK